MQCRTELSVVGVSSRYQQQHNKKLISNEVDKEKSDEIEKVKRESEVSTNSQEGNNCHVKYEAWQQ